MRLYRKVYDTLDRVNKMINPDGTYNENIYRDDENSIEKIDDPDRRISDIVEDIANQYPDANIVYIGDPRLTLRDLYRDSAYECQDEFDKYY